MLNAELKSMNSILTWESLFSRWVRARWRVEEIASSVERFGRYAKIKNQRRSCLSIQQVSVIGVEEVKRLNMSSCIVEDREQLLHLHLCI